jgi:RNA ligase (TIGR02306 family)
MTKPVEIVTVTRIIPIFKNSEPANAIEVINFDFLNGDECGFNVVSQKGIYQVGDKAIYIQPDYCLPDTELFKSFTAPNGNPNKSKLGKQNRIKAIKFNFQFEDSSDPIYSNGILLPLDEVGLPPEVGSKPEDRDESFDIAEFLGITKYEEPEKFKTGNSKGNLPGFLYKTDEENAANLQSHINRVLAAGERIGWTLKVDGSSFTQYFEKGVDGWTTGICSRLLEKKDVDNQNSSDPWVSLSHSSALYEKGMKYCQDNNRELAFRAEIYGEGLKGSGNKLNPHSKLIPNIVVFGIDTLESGFATKLLPMEVEGICKRLEVDYVPYLEIFPKNYDELIEVANKIFENYREQKNWVIEGIVVRTLDSNKLSAKVMNNAYDAKK